MKKVSINDLGLDFNGLTGEPRTFLEKSAQMVCDVVNKALDGCATQEEVENKFKGINDNLKGYDAEKFAAAIKQYDELSEQVKNLGDSIEKMKQAGMTTKAINKFDEKVTAMLESEKYRHFAEGHSIKTGSFDGFSLKDIVSMTDNYTGDVLISQQQKLVVQSVANQRVHLRDILTVLQGDPNYPTLTYAEVYDLDRNARYTTENGKLPKSSFKLREKTDSVTRLGTHLPISKRMLKSRAYVRSFILNMLPEAVYLAEDWNILFGDGNGEHLIGIVNRPGVTSIESIINGPVVTGAAGSVKSVTPYGGGALVEFANPYDSIKKGMMITLAGATATSLNKTFPVVKVNDRQVLLRGVTLAAEEATPSAITFTVNNGAFKSIEAPNTGDVIKTGFAVMNIGQFHPNAVALNPITINAIECEKDSIGRNLNLISVGADGIKRIGVYAIIESDDVQPGDYIIGDFKTAANIVDYTNLTLEFAQDVNTELANEVVLIAQEEIIFPVTMPYAFACGNLDDLKQAITKTA